MTRKQQERYLWLTGALQSLGMARMEVDALLRCSRVLSTWGEHECNGAIQRDEQTDKPYWYNTMTGKRIGRTADREAGALRRAKAICERYGLSIYHQGDPRGCSLYVIRPGDVPEGKDVDSFYTRGIAVCID